MHHASPATLPEDSGDSLPADFRAVYEEHVDFVWRNLRALGVPHAELEDATQETFVVAYRRRHDFRADASMRGWLYGIARRIAYRHRRGGGRRDRLHDALAKEPIVRPEAGLLLERLDARRAMEHFMGGLPDAQREVFVLAELEELTGQEIAEAIGIKPNTVWSRLRSARDSFQRFLDVLRARERGVEFRQEARAREQPGPEQRRRVAGLVAMKIGGPGVPWWSVPLAAEVKVFAATVAVGLTSLVVVDQALPETAPPTEAAVVAPGSQARLERPKARRRAQEPPVASSSVIAAAPSSDPRPGTPPLDGAPSKSLARRAPASSGDVLEQEAALISEIRGALPNDPRRALQLCAEHARRFSDGVLTLEADTLRVRALCGVGDHAQAKNLARQIATSAPGSPAAVIASHGCPAPGEKNPTNTSAAGEQGGV